MYENESEYVRALFGAVADALDGERSVAGWRVSRPGLVRGPSDEGKLYDPLGTDGTGFPVRDRGTPVYLVAKEEAPGEPVAVLVHCVDRLPVATQEWGDGLPTPSGLAVLHASTDDSWTTPALPVLKRTWATLRARAEDHGDWRFGVLEEFLADARLDTADWPRTTEPGDYANGTLVLQDGDATLIGVLVDSDGCNTVHCLDETGEPVGVLMLCQQFCD